MDAYTEFCQAAGAGFASMADLRAYQRAARGGELDDPMVWCPKCEGRTYADADCIYCGHYVPGEEWE